MAPEAAKPGADQASKKVADDQKPPLPAAAAAAAAAAEAATNSSTEAPHKKDTDVDQQSGKAIPDTRPPADEKAAVESDGSDKEEQPTDEYTTDNYTEDGYSDEYTEDSVFSDSNYSRGSGSENDDDEQERQTSDANRRSWLQSSEDPSVAVFDTHFSSGTTSPNPVDALNATRATNALAPSHRFESHTPWGTSTGRLTRARRDKGRLWDDPNTVTAANEDFAGPQFAQQRLPGQYGQLQQPHHHDATQASASMPHARAHANPQAPNPYQGSALASGAGASQAYNAARANGIDSSSNSLTLQQQRQYQQLLQMQQQQQKQAAPANQVVNVVSVQQGTKNYTQLQQQMLREQQLQQDTIDGKLLQGRRAPRIVTIAQFIKSVSRLLGIGFPSATCTEARLTVALVAVLGVRTGLDVWFANFNARVVRAVVTYDRMTLLRRLLPEYLAMIVPMAAVNQTIKWVISSLTIALRVRLGRYAHERYVDGITNITWNQLHRQGPDGSTPAYERPDWLLTVQIHRFADMFPRLIADVVKPTFDWFVFSRLLSRFISRSGSLTMVLYVVLANVIIRLSSPPVGKNASRLAQLEEKYRGVYARISSIIQRAAASSTPLVHQQQQQQHRAQAQADKASTILSPDPSPLTTPHATDVRMANGHHSQQPAQAFVPRVQAAFRQRAKEALDGSLDGVASNVVSTNIRRFFGGVGETILAKYGATLTAYYLLSRPLCSPGRRLASEILHDPAAVMMSYSRNSSYLINLSQATTRLLLMVNDLPKFVWSTVKVDRLLRSLDVHSRYRNEVAESSVADDDRTSYTTS
ncbi:hypothetical protein GQ54DRAFT_283522 [Martensiomyces pterosporus]|nr:hypothetical protein GQ54DRAFT_283522 [Martensiomyces pterosporus]